jgi:hypothetical protein
MLARLDFARGVVADVDHNARSLAPEVLDQPQGMRRRALGIALVV